MRYFILFCFILLPIACSEDNPVDNFENTAPSISAMTASPDTIGFNESSLICCCAHDSDDHVLAFSWESEHGTFLEGDSSITWIAPEYECQTWIVCTVNDPFDSIDKDSITVTVVESR